MEDTLLEEGEEEEGEGVGVGETEERKVELPTTHIFQVFFLHRMRHETK